MLPKQFLLLLAFLLATAEEIQEDPVTLLRRNEQPEIVYHGAELYEEKQAGVNQETNYPCLGCPFDLNPDAEGVSTLVDTALRHVESERDEKHALVRVLRLQQQVVAGIKYLLLVEIAPTTCSKDTTISFCPIDQSKGSYICEIEYFEQPWLNSGKNIIRNNCTLSQEYLPKEPEKPIRRKEQEERPDFLSELESQIIPDSSFVNPDNNRYVYSVNEIEEPLNNPDFMTPNFVFKDSYPAYDVQELASPKEEMINFIAKDINSSDNKKGADSDASSGSNEDNEENYSIRKRSLTNEGGKSDTSESLDDSKSFNDSIDSNSSENKKKNNIRKRNVNINGGKSDTSESSDDSIDSNSSEKKKKNNIKKRNVNDNGGKSDTSEESKSSKSSKDATNSESSNSSENRHRKKDNGNDVPHVEFQRKRSIGDLDNLTEDEQILLVKFSKKTAASLGYGNAKITVNHVDKAKIDGVYYKARVTFDKFPLVKICTLIVHTEDDLSNPSLVKSNCNAKRTRRSNMIPGGIVDKKKDDPEVKQFLNEGLLHLDSQSPHKNRYKIKEILSASTQVVSGTLLRVKAKVIVSDCEKGNNGNVDECGELEGATGKVCNFKIWNRPWLPKGRETNIKCEEEEQTYSFRTRRDIQENPTGDYKRTRRGIPGGVLDLEKDDQRVKESLTEGLLHLDSHSPHEHRYKIKEILGASTQVVAGTLLRIKAKMVVSNCKKGTSVNLDECGELEGAPSKVCNFNIWNQPWLENGKETNITCENDEQTYSFRSGNKKARRSVKLGGIGDIQKDDPQVKGFLNDGLLHLDSHSPHKNRYKIKEILSATTQSVSGTLFRVKAKVVVSDCEKGHNGNLDKCGELEGATSKVCNFEIWNQPWLEKGRETNIQCEDEGKTYSFRMRRDLQDVKEDSSFEDEELQFLFKSFTKVYGKTYMNEMEYNFRQQVLKENLNTIRMLNKFEQGSATYGLSRFADLTQEEFSNMHGLRMDLRNQNDVPFARADIPDIEIPTEFDWRKKNAVSEVKDQGQCGSCWAFSAIGNIEGQYAIKYKKLQQFSEQELVDCDKLDEGCNGGLMDNAYSTIERIGGLESETDYPYKAEDEKCLFKKSKVKVQLSGAVNISHDETDMAKWLVQNGPIAIALNANAMQFYMGGVSHPWKFLCSPASLDHGVLIVGYGVDNFPKFNKTLPYWIVKNSWGKSWGEQGYYRVYRGDGTCGLNQTPSSGIVA